MVRARRGRLLAEDGEGDRGFIDRNLLPVVGAVPLAKLRASDLDGLYRRLLVSGAVGDGGLAPGAGPRRIAFLSWQRFEHHEWLTTHFDALHARS